MVRVLIKVQNYTKSFHAVLVCETLFYVCVLPLILINLLSAVLRSPRLAEEEENRLNAALLKTRSVSDHSLAYHDCDWDEKKTCGLFSEI